MIAFTNLAFTYNSASNWWLNPTLQWMNNFGMLSSRPCWNVGSRACHEMWPRFQEVLQHLDLRSGAGPPPVTDQNVEVLLQFADEYEATNNLGLSMAISCFLEGKPRPFCGSTMDRFSFFLEALKQIQAFAWIWAYYPSQKKGCSWVETAGQVA